MKSRHFDILSNRFLGFPPQKHEDVKPLVSIVDLQKAERMDKPHHQTDYNILAPTVSYFFHFQIQLFSFVSDDICPTD
jgi:hypothetical protein